MPPTCKSFLDYCWGYWSSQEFWAPFNFVVGNPPYVRQELIPDALMAEYRARYKTVYDRADLYVPFIEHSLNLLAPVRHEDGVAYGSFARFFNSANTRPARRPSLVAVESNSSAWSVRP
jgi:methylase of polypeptide subunit release factors